MFKVDQSQEDLCSSSEALCLVSHRCLSIYFTSIYILCAQNDGRPWGQNSSTAVHQFHRHHIIAPNGPELRMSRFPEGRAWTAALRFAYVDSVWGLNQQMWLWKTAQMFEHVCKQQLFTAPPWRAPCGGAVVSYVTQKQAHTCTSSVNS